MKKIKNSFIILSTVMLLATTVFSQTFTLGIMQDKKGAAAKYAPLVEYLKSKGVPTKIIAAKNYPAAAKMFSAGKLDAMFAGSGVAGSMIIKDVAEPIVRPVNKSGWSTYWAVILAKKGTPNYTSGTDIFKGKKVIFCSLASSGEFYFRSLYGSNKIDATMQKAASHGAAIDALNRGMADYAVVKNRVWDEKKASFSSLVEIGKDAGENPNGTLIISKKADKATVGKIKEMLLGIKADSSAKAKAAKDKLKITGYIVTTADDFKTTIPMLKKAGVSKSFNFTF